MASSASSSGATTSTASTPEPQSNGNGAGAALIIDASDRNADLYYASGFLAGDPFTFVSIDGRRYLILSNLEYTRGTKESNVDEVVSYSELESEVAKSGTDPVRMGDVVMHFLRTRGVSRIEVPGNFPVATADVMRESGFEIVPRNGGAFFPERECKNADEITRVEHAQACTEAAMLNAIETIRRSDVVDGALVLEGEPLTSERLKSMIAIELLRENYIARDIIVAPGDQGCDPHNRGSGPLHAGESIIIDIFPQGDHRYWGDMTRTVCKGPASTELQAIYDSVKRAQEMALSAIRPGVTGAEVHQFVEQVFEEDGFETSIKDGVWSGFFHGTGHGLGLDIHEAPSLSRRGGELREGMIVTVEPGLYYPGIGGVRIEDLVVVTADGQRNLNRAPKELCV